jgi:hypothetical protein
VGPPRGYKDTELPHRLVVRQSPASKEVNPEAEESTALGAVIRQRLVKTQQTEKA